MDEENGLERTLENTKNKTTASTWLLETPPTRRPSLTATPPRRSECTGTVKMPNEGVPLRDDGRTTHSGGVTIRNMTPQDFYIDQSNPNLSTEEQLLLDYMNECELSLVAVGPQDTIVGFLFGKFAG